MKVRDALSTDESGAAIIELVMVVPLILMVAAGLLDLGLLIRSELALDSAATAAVRLCMDNPSCIDDEQILREYLQQADPLMENAQVSIVKETQLTDSYAYHFYLKDDDQHIVRSDSHRTSVPIKVTLSLTQEYFTLLGRGISLAFGGDGLMRAQAAQSGTVDTTAGDTW